MSRPSPAAAAAPRWLPFLQETLAREGRFEWQVEGRSMWPTLPPGSLIEIRPHRGAGRLGALYVFMNRETPVVHRLVRRRGTQWILQGDGRRRPDRPVVADLIVGRVSSATYEGRRCWPGRWGRLSDGRWLLRHHLLRLWDGVARRLLRGGGG